MDIIATKALLSFTILCYIYICLLAISFYRWNADYSLK